MAEQIAAWKSSTGKTFATKEEAVSDEIRTAAESLAAVDTNHLINVANGYSGCKTTREALCLLAEAVRRQPIPDEPAVASKGA